MPDAVTESVAGCPLWILWLCGWPTTTEGAAQPLATNTHAPPSFEPSPGPPTMAVFPSAEIATEVPCWTALTVPVPTTLVPCWDHTPAVRVYTHAAPAGLSPGPPTMAMLPSADIATDLPCWAGPLAPVPTSVLPCCDHTPPLRVYTHAAPTPGFGEVSKYPPPIAVFPSPEIATEVPWSAAPPAMPEPTSLLPCCVHTPPLRVNTHAAPLVSL